MFNLRLEGCWRRCLEGKGLKPCEMFDFFEGLSRRLLICALAFNAFHFVSKKLSPFCVEWEVG